MIIKKHNIALRILQYGVIAKIGYVAIAYFNFLTQFYYGTNGKFQIRQDR